MSKKKYYTILLFLQINKINKINKLGMPLIFRFLLTRKGMKVSPSDFDEFSICNFICEYFIILTHTKTEILYS